MKTTLYYFSATGNCLSTAREIKKYYDDARIISVSSLKEQKEIEDDSDIVGYICPVYYGTSAYLMMEAIRKMVFKKNPYIFLMTTCKGHTGVVASRINEILKTKNQKLSLHRNIIMPGNSWISTKEENEERLKLQSENIKNEMNDILNLKEEDYSMEESFKDTPVDRPNNFRGICVDENCIQCKTCIKVCPMNNIEFNDGKIVINDQCITCLACFHWCPKEAIYMSKEENVSRRFKYHHPDVTLIDIMDQHK